MMTGVGLFAVLLAVSASPAAAEALPLLQIDPALLREGKPARSAPAPRQAAATEFPAPAVPAPLQSDPTAARKAAEPHSGTQGRREHFLQIGAFSVRANAEARLRQLASEPGPWGSKLLIRPRGKLFLLQAGPWPGAAAAQSVRAQLRESRNIDSVYLAVVSPAASPEAASIPLSANLPNAPNR